MKYVAFLIAALFGVIYSYPLMYLWGLVAQFNPIDDYIFDAIHSVPRWLFYLFIWLHDFALNSIFTLPLVLLIFFIDQRHRWSLLFLAWFSLWSATDLPSFANIIEHFNMVGWSMSLFHWSLSFLPMVASFALLNKFYFENSIFTKN